MVSGKVHAEGACDEWEISSVSGEVELLCTVAPAKKVQISSVHGDVRLALPGTIRGFVAEATGALGCEIINEFGPNRYGTCGLPIRMETEPKSSKGASLFTFWPRRRAGIQSEQL